MTKFSGTGKNPVRANLTAAVRTTRRRLATLEGGEAYEREPESELFVLAATNMVGEDTCYERAADRDARFVDLVHRVTATNPVFIAGTVAAAGGEGSHRAPRVGQGVVGGAEADEGEVGFAQYLRQHMGMRSAAVVVAAEYVAAGGANGRSVIARALQRPDEPAELIGYWLAMYGRNLPMPVKRGVADAVRCLYSERAALRYDGLSRSIRADVIELTHPSPKDGRQSALFKHLLDRRHHDDARPDPAVLPMLAAAAELKAVPADERRAVLRPAVRRRWLTPGSRGSGCPAGCRAGSMPRRGRRSSRRWV